MTILPNSMYARDIQHLVHPSTNVVRHRERGPILMDRGQGVYVYGSDGKEYLEAMAGLWSVAVGFGEKRLAEAAARQMSTLPYYHIYSHKSNNPAIDLAERLARMTPEGLGRVFFTNSGSEANDSVIKLVWYYNNALGRPQKKKIISRMRAYHGITIASGSLTGLPWNHQDFDLPMSNVIHVSCPGYYRYAEEGETEEAFATRLAEELEAAILREGPETVAAFIGEPLMGAGGVFPPPATYWQKIQAVCRKYDVLISADEVINGFGRLGQPFGCDLYDIKPDFMVVSKQLTSSYQPLGAVIMSEDVYGPIAENTNRLGTFGHGFTTSGHPVACAVGLANLDIIEQDGLFENARAMGEVLHGALKSSIADHPLVGDIRGAGLIVGVELVEDKKTKKQFSPLGKMGAYVYERGHHHGLVLRNIEDTLAICPPLIINEEQVHLIVGRLRQSLDDALEWRRNGG